MSTTHAESASATLRLLDQHPDMDIVVLDLMMPGMGRGAPRHLASSAEIDFARSPFTACCPKVWRRRRYRMA